MDAWKKQLLRTWLIPGGVLLLLASVVLQGGFVPLAVPAMDFYYWAAFSAAFLLALRFRSSKILFAMVTLLLAHRAVTFFAGARILPAGPGRIAFESVALLVPLNYVVAGFIRERGLNLDSILPRLGLIFLESVFVAVICRPEERSAPWFVRALLVDGTLFRWTKIPQPALLAFTAAFVILLSSILRYRKPVESGLFWSFASAFLGLQMGVIGRIGNGYFATSALILAASIIESSYALAYQDELTALPSRRSFQDALHGLEHPFTVAVVDIDHFKSVNDTFGHDTGDQVLRLVARHLGAVTGGGQGYRVGGEEFTILFPGKSTKDVLPHLELLRVSIAESSFRIRNMPDRRLTERGPDRRSAVARRAKPNVCSRTVENLSVTVSIGVAGSQSNETSVQRVIETADQSLYAAKRGGRNRVEVAGTTRPKPRRFRKNIA